MRKDENVLQLVHSGVTVLYQARGGGGSVEQQQRNNQQFVHALQIWTLQ